MKIIKKIIRKLFNLMGLQIVNIDGYNAQQDRINEIIFTANKFYKETLQNRLDSLSDPLYLQFLELKYGGYVTDVPATIRSRDVSRMYGYNHTGGVE